MNLKKILSSFFIVSLFSNGIGEFHLKLIKFLHLKTLFLLVFADEIEPLPMNDETNPSGRALPPISQTSNDLMPLGANAAKSTLYLGTFQILAMPFSPGSIPPNIGSFPSIAPPSKRD